MLALTRDQHVAALVYARLHALLYGKPWSYACPLARELGYHGSERPEDLLVHAKKRIDRMNALLNPLQRQQVANVCISGWVPTWF